METATQLAETIRANILTSSIIIVLVLIIMFLVYKSGPPAIRKTESMTGEERELDNLIKQLEERQSDDGPQ